MTAPTREQIDAALAVVAYEVETHRHDMSPTLEQSYRVLLSAIPALTAELEASRDLCATTRRELDLRQALLEAERKAHAETRRGYEEDTADYHADYHAEQTRLQHELDRRQGQLDREVTRRANAEAEVQRWQSATGHASPEACRDALVREIDASPWETERARVEPGADLIERLSEVEHDAEIDDSFAESPPDEQRGPYWELLTERQRRNKRAGIRAVVMALAEMGVEAMPTADECVEAVRVVFRNAAHVGSIAMTQGLIASHLAPVLGARRVLELPSEEEIAITFRVAETAHYWTSAGRELGSFDDLTELGKTAYLAGSRAVLDLFRSRSVESSYVPRAFSDSTIELALSWLESFANASPRIGAAVAAIGIVKAYRDQRDAAPPTDEQLAEEADEFDPCPNKCRGQCAYCVRNGSGYIAGDRRKCLLKSATTPTEEDCPPSCTGSCAACCRARREGRR